MTLVLFFSRFVTNGTIRNRDLCKGAMPCKSLFSCQTATTYSIHLRSPAFSSVTWFCFMLRGRLHHWTFAIHSHRNSVRLECFNPTRQQSRSTETRWDNFYVILSCLSTCVRWNGRERRGRAQKESTRKQFRISQIGCPASPCLTHAAVCQKKITQISTSEFEIWNFGFVLGPCRFLAKCCIIFVEKSFENLLAES